MESLLGKTLKNRYRVVESLGRGGMADVYKVWDEERAVYLAMKVLRQDLAQDPIFLRRFQREAKALAQLQHPHIVRFYGLERDDLLAFLLMEYVDGISLQGEILRSEGKALPMEHIQEVMEAVCSALHYAHHQGLVHCDIKPGNILIDKNGQIYLTDFGIARGMDAATSTMVGIGTPAYMAPELIKGEDPTPQTDIYALGIVLYEMLTGGERPFTGERAAITGTTAEKVRWEHIELKPTPVTHFNESIPHKLDHLVMKCLEKETQTRFKSIDILWEVFYNQSNSMPAISQIDISDQANHSTRKVEIGPNERVVGVHGVKNSSSNNKKKKNFKWLAILGTIVLVCVGFVVAIGRVRIDIGDDQDATPIPPQTDFNFAAITSANVHSLDLYATKSYGQLQDVLYSPQGDMLIAGTQSSVLILNPITLEIQRSIEYEEEGILTSIDISSDGDMLVIGVDNGTILVVDLRNFELIERFYLADTTILQVKFSTDGRYIACSTADFKVKLLDSHNGNILQEFSGYEQPVSDLAFSGDDHLLVASSHDGKVIVWNLTTYQQEKTFYDLKYGAVAVEFSPDSSLLAIAENLDNVFIYNTSDWRLRTQFETEHFGTMFDLDFSHDGQKIATCSLRGDIRIWDVSSGELLTLIDRHESYVYSVAFSQDDYTIASGSLDGTLRIWDVENGEQKRMLSGFMDFAGFIYPKKGSDQLISSFGTGDIGVWKTNSFKNDLIIDYPRSFLSTVAFSEDSEDVLFTNGKLVLLGSTEDDYISHSYEGFDSAIYALAISPDKDLIAAGGYDHFVKIYDAETEEVLHNFSMEQESVEYLVFSDDSERLLVIYESSIYEINIDLFAEGKSIYLQNLDSYVTDLEKNSLDGNVYLSFADGKVGVYDFNTHKLEYLNFLSGSRITDIAFNENYSLLAEALAEGAIQFWDLHTQTLAGDITLKKGDFFEIDDIAFSGDGKYFLILGSDAVLRIYAVTENNEISIVQSTDVVVLSESVTRNVIAEKVSPIDGMNMVFVPAGEFEMGTNDWESDERPVHTVFLDSFWIDQTEVTNSQYQQCVDAGVCILPEDISSYTHENYYGNPDFADYPVIYVNYGQAKTYCEWAGRRLPTEAEWEKAARGTDGRIFPWGNEDPNSSLVNYKKNIGDTTKVGNYPVGVSPYGALDMAGNVWEWVSDYYNPEYYIDSPYANPEETSRRECEASRGGSWISNMDVRSTKRKGAEYYHCHASLMTGFRCALTD